MNAQRPPISILDEKIMACSFWTHLVCFMFMSIWFSTKCFTAFSVASFMSMWFSTQCLKSLSAPKCFNMCSKSHLPTHAVFFWLALPSCQPKCAPKLCHAGQPWHVHCILGYIYMPCILFGRGRHQEMRHGQHSQMTVNYFASIAPSGST